MNVPFPVSQSSVAGQSDKNLHQTGYADKNSVVNLSTNELIKTAQLTNDSQGKAFDNTVNNDISVNATFNTLGSNYGNTVYNSYNQRFVPGFNIPQQPNMIENTCAPANSGSVNPWSLYPYSSANMQYGPMLQPVPFQANMSFRCNRSGDLPHCPPLITPADQNHYAQQYRSIPQPSAMVLQAPSMKTTSYPTFYDLSATSIQSESLYQQQSNFFNGYHHTREGYFQVPSSSIASFSQPETSKVQLSMKRDNYLLKQIEYYLSPQHLKSDLFIRHQMDSEGYLPLISVLNFRKVHNVTNDVALVSRVLQYSTILELSKDGLKVRPKYNWHIWLLPDDNLKISLNKPNDSTDVDNDKASNE
ncbi:la domain-containing protein [Ditylenchus destructor]|nr:la domain-containing protein [Ditylenchus destructor]